ncbi:general stress protein [Alkalicoccus halolimnae]|uniref:General stress protein n=1 Tax=Alkalicoccus halolimnae TaxID=1667239 RepID=A0A5C7F6C4_9BACI|nr:general stress protein [Alkalicoccus halolimnae]TXF85563.1 hypothetical protein FTX54_08205 [Alkalicoccus halolimnae]
MTRVVGMYEEKEQMVEEIKRLQQEGIDPKNVTVVLSREGHRTVFADDLFPGITLEKIDTEHTGESGWVAKMKEKLNLKQEKARKEEGEETLVEAGVSDEDAEKYRSGVEDGRMVLLVEDGVKISPEGRGDTATTSEQMGSAADIVDEAPPAPEPAEETETDDPEKAERAKKQEEVVDENQQDLADESPKAETDNEKHK